MNELDFINRLKELAPHPAARGLNDDAAVLTFGRHKLILTHDMMLEGVHYLPDANPADVAWKLIAVNLSDLAAKGAKPLGFLLAYCRSGDEWDELFMLGLKQALDHFGVPLLGGDTVTGRMECDRSIGLTAIGESRGHLIPARSSAAIGHALFVTGTIGDGWAGLQIAKKRATGSIEVTRKLLKVYNRPEPKLAEGRALATLVGAMMDISDGLLLDASRMSEASGLALEIDLEKIPLSPEFVAIFGEGRDARLKAATGGDDYQLLLTAGPETVLPAAVTRIGKCKPGKGISLVYKGQPIERPGVLGFIHA